MEGLRMPKLKREFKIECFLKAERFNEFAPININKRVCFPWGIKPLFVLLDDAFGGQSVGSK
jgi:hypothetical protein